MKIKKTTLKIFLTVAVLGILSFFSLQEASADGPSFSVSPSTILIQAKPPADAWTAFTIVNKSSQPVSFTIGYKPFDPNGSKNGRVIFLPDGSPAPGQDKNIFKKMQVVDNNNISHDILSLGPKQSERFRLHIALPKNEPASDYYFSLIFAENTASTTQNESNDNINAQKSTSTLIAGIAINILLAVGDKETPQAAIDTFSTPFTRESGPVHFSLEVHNYGEHFISPHGSILVKNMYGQAIGKISIPQSVILSGTSRAFSNASLLSGNQANATSLNQTQSPDLQIVWPEKFLLGMYSATLSLSLSDNGQVYTRTIHFFVFPLNLFIIIVAILLLLILFISRVKRKMA